MIERVDIRKIRNFRIVKILANSGTTGTKNGTRHCPTTL